MTGRYGSASVDGTSLTIQNCNTSTCGSSCTPRSIALTSCSRIGQAHSYVLSNEASIAPPANGGAVYIQNFGSDSSCAFSSMVDVHYNSAGVCDDSGAAPNYTTYVCGSGVTVYNCLKTSGPDQCDVTVSNCTVYGTHAFGSCSQTASGNYAKFYCDSFPAIGDATRTAAVISLIFFALLASLF